MTPKALLPIRLLAALASKLASSVTSAHSQSRIDGQLGCMTLSGAEGVPSAQTEECASATHCKLCGLMLPLSGATPRTLAHPMTTLHGPQWLYGGRMTEEASGRRPSLAALRVLSVRRYDYGPEHNRDRALPMSVPIASSCIVWMFASYPAMNTAPDSVVWCIWQTC